MSYREKRVPAHQMELSEVFEQMHRVGRPIMLVVQMDIENLLFLTTLHPALTDNKEQRVKFLKDVKDLIQQQLDVEEPKH